MCNWSGYVAFPSSIFKPSLKIAPMKTPPKGGGVTQGGRYPRRVPEPKNPAKAAGFGVLGLARGQPKNCAPFALMVEPLMNPASSATRKATQRAISSGSPRRPAGMPAMIDSRTFSGTAITISVAI